MIIFDDSLGRLGPMTDLRAAFEVRTGMLTTAGRIVARRSEPLAGYWAPLRLAAMVAERVDTPVNALPDDDTLLCVNGRWMDPGRDLQFTVGQAALETGTGHIVAACLTAADARTLLQTGELPDAVDTREIGEQRLYRFPWDVLAALPRHLSEDIRGVRLPDAQVPRDVGQVMGDHPVEVHVAARVGPGVIFDAERGPIIVHENAIIRPHAVLCGPCSIGSGSAVIDHALIKPNTVVGPRCKVGGEVGATIFQSHSNKSHDGHLGDSWVGEWVNLGAGTTNSNLLNTYGEVTMRVEPDGPRHRTGLTFLGAIVGDHVKTAIGTRIMTGSVIGTGAMVASTAPPPATVKRFAWLTDEGERVYRFEKFLESAVRMMARRDRTPSAAYVEALRELHDQIT